MNNISGSNPAPPQSSSATNQTANTQTTANTQKPPTFSSKTFTDDEIKDAISYAKGQKLSDLLNNPTNSFTPMGNQAYNYSAKGRGHVHVHNQNGPLQKSRYENRAETIGSTKDMMNDPKLSTAKQDLEQNFGPNTTPQSGTHWEKNVPLNNPQEEHYGWPAGKDPKKDPPQLIERGSLNVGSENGKDPFIYSSYPDGFAKDQTGRPVYKDEHIMDTQKILP